MNLAETFINLNAGSPEHLWVVITRPTTQGEVAIVNFTTRYSPFDDSCVIAAGEHPFVNVETIVYFPGGSLVKDDLLDRWQQRGILQSHEPVSASLLERIQRGSLESPYTKQAIQNAVRETLGI